MLTILGVDPGTRVAGYGVIEAGGRRLRAIAHGTIAVGKADLPGRLAGVYDGLGEVIERFRPDVVAVESVFGGKNIQSAIKLGEGRGIILLRAAQAGLPVVEYPPATIKKAVAGSGRADKGQVQRMVQRVLGLVDLPSPADAADALAIAICHGHRLPVARRA